MWSKNTEDSWSCKRGQDKCSRCIWSLIDRALKMNLTKLIRRDTGEQMKDRDLCNNIYVNAWQRQPIHTVLMWVAFNILLRGGKAFYQYVLSKTKSTRTRQGPSSPNGSRVLRRQQYNAMQCLYYSRCLDAYNTMQCLDYDEVLRRLFYCFAD